MSEMLNQTQRNQLIQLHQEIGLENMRLFVPLSDKSANRFIKKAKTFGIEVLGEEIILFADTTRRGSGKDGMLLTDQFFHTTIAYDIGDGKSNLIQRVAYEMIKSIHFDPNLGKLIIKVESNGSVGIGHSQIQVITTQPIAKVIIDAIETIRECISSEQQKQERASGAVVTCTGCKANVNTVDQFCPYCRTEIINPNANSDSGMNFDSLFGSMNNMFGDNSFKMNGFGNRQATTTSSTTTTTVSTENGKIVTKTTTRN